ncbi:phosphotransferase [Arthrobacter sp. ERGS1:01]|uniref:phosphotransferase n=1 Tax=Arthrobacter sp. ERGS1:01 TaxID=1704044 RepID=UPI000A4B1759
MPATFLDLLADWLPRQRWYPLKGDAGLGATLRCAGTLELPSSNPGVRFVVVFVDVTRPVDEGGADDAGHTVTLQVPVALHFSKPVTAPGASPSGTSLIGEVGPSDSTFAPPAGEDTGGLTGGWAVDALSDPEFLNAWLAVLTSPQRPASLSTWCSDAFTEAAGMAGDVVDAVRPVTAEQSNSSVVFELAGQRFIAKFLRVLQAGAHPEVELGRALAAAGSNNVPALHATVSAPVPAASSSPATLFVIHTFLDGGRDGWETALGAASSGTDFAAEARAMGSAVAQVHASLRSTLGSAACTGPDAAAFVETVISRLRWAWDLAGASVGPYEPELDAVIDGLRALRRLPEVQRIHGDLHLGQLVRAGKPGATGWYLLDFEGEPLRPLAQRGLPDVPLRDVIGMLRSFDYAGAQAARGGTVTADDAAAWTRACCEAFLDGYRGSAAGGDDADPALFSALWLDKALYEVVYELQNRPDWLSVPVLAVRELFESSERSVDMGMKNATPWQWMPESWQVFPRGPTTRRIPYWAPT